MDFGTSIKNWLGQSTTGQGATLLAGTFLSYLTHEITAPVAIVGAASALILVFWPQKHTTAAETGVVVGDAEKLFAAYQQGIAHGKTIGQAAASLMQQGPLLGQAVQDAVSLAQTAASEGASSGGATQGAAVVATATASPAGTPGTGAAGGLAIPPVPGTAT